MLYEKYNSRYILRTALHSETSDDKCGFIRYLNLINTSLYKDELCLQNKLLRESAVYEYLKVKPLLINTAIKLIKYSNRKHSVNFNHTQNIISEINSPLIKLYTRIAKMFSEKGNYYSALQWINKVYTFYQINPPDGTLNKNFLASTELRGYIISKRLNYLVSKRKKGKLTYVNKIAPLSKIDYYYISKKWYEEYKLFILTNNELEYEIQLDENAKFPREIDNYELLSGKEMFEWKSENNVNTQYILGDVDKAMKIKEDEWMFLKAKFGCTNELKVRNDKDKEIVYKVLVCSQKEREGNNFYFFKPKYLIFNNDNDLYTFFQTIYNEGNTLKIYQFNKALTKKEKKELLFDIMFFYSIKKSEKHFVHEDYLNLFNNDKSFIYNEKYKYNYGGFIFVDVNEFISIRNKSKCFQCQLNDNCIQCNECSRNSSLQSKFEFCSDECLSKHKEQYHKQIYLYQTFEYNIMQMLKDINNNSIYDNGGLIGFTNTNKINHTYSQINSILQCLLHCMGFVDYFINKHFLNEPLNKSYTNNNNEFPISNALIKLIEQMWTNDNTFQKTRTQLSNEIILNALTLSDSKYQNFITNNKHYTLNSFEFIQDIFNYISRELNRSQSTLYDERTTSSLLAEPLIQYNHSLNEYNSIIQNLFYIQFHYKNKCKLQSCSHVSNIYKSSFSLDISIPSKKTFKYYIKFKYFICGTIKPEIREYEIDESIKTAGDFKKKYFTQVIIFDIVGLNKETKQEFPLILNDYEELFIYNNDKLELAFPEYELVLYESTNDHWNYALYFIYPFIYKIPKNKNISILDGIFSSIGCCSNCTIDTNDLFKFDKKYKNIMFYPMRLKIEKSELHELRDCIHLRQSIFSKMGLTIPEIPISLKEKTLLFKEQGIISSYNDDKYLEPVRNLSTIKEELKYFLFLGEETNINFDHFFTRYLTMEREGEIIEKEIGISFNDLIHNMLNIQRDLFTCQKCKNATLSNITISKLPIYLNVHMKRIDFENKRKIGTLVEYPDVVNMFSFVDKEKMASFEKDSSEKECVYELYAVNGYRGNSLEEGHFVSYAKIRGEWFCFDGGNVYKDNKYRNGDSVILFYKRRKMFI